MNWEEVLRLPESEYVCDAVPECLMLTVVYWPPERICATDLEMDGFSATHKTRMYHTKLAVVFSRGASQDEVFVVGPMT